MLTLRSGWLLACRSQPFWFHGVRSRCRSSDASRIILGLLVLGALDYKRRATGPGIAFWTIVLGSVLAYVSSVAWGLGLPGLSVRSVALVAVASSIWLVGAGITPTPASWHWAGHPRRFGIPARRRALLDAAGALLPDRPAMTIEPLKPTIALVAIGLVVRSILATAGWAAWRPPG